MTQVTPAQYAAGSILINIRANEGLKIMKKLGRLRKIQATIVSGRHMPYTEEDIITLLSHKLVAIVSGNIPMTLFWMQCTDIVTEDIKRAIKMEHLYQHQAERINKIAKQYGERAEELSTEIKSIRSRIGN